ncbi:ChrR family anti-sigma-E factor [Hoeflea prorocentri]|uniref:ChrR family anti-sigma-E factor n=1 Tax=Hoeflea prorocentri TaxID=1922333 RepID=A0A9X3UKG0_9HYPH|nr:ChrR family anti-sigma-E factor [Hoeflea prorocentri]MCY6382226.1 ChrR family anti-sigma-E factor [Hoeflea prorocentri]MDA5400026.1 ChrR family anti-sigma-E factor [Hoeflea prorocentri]
MSIHHHLDDASLMRYATGDLDPAFAVVVASHLAMCEDCRHAVHLAEAVGGDCLEHAPAAALSNGSFERLSRMIDADGDTDAVPAARHRLAANAGGDVPLPLQNLIGQSLDDLPWRRVVPGVQRHRIEMADTNGSLFLLKIGSGRKIPEHGHGGTEMTLILRGSYHDEMGRFAKGDIADLDEHVEHQPLVDSDEPCICLVATEEPTRFKGVVSRLMQPLVGI